MPNQVQSAAKVVSLCVFGEELRLAGEYPPSLYGSGGNPGHLHAAMRLVPVYLLPGGHENRWCSLSDMPQAQGR